VVRWSFSSAPGESCSLLGDQYSLRPSYYTYWLYARELGNRLVQAATSAVTQVTAYAAWRDDDALSVVLVNKTTGRRLVSLDLGGFSPRSAGRYTIAGESFDARQVTLNGQQLTVDNVGGGPNAIQPEAVDSAALDLVDMPPLSIVMIIYR
jgi:hypothetical protein